MTVHPQIAGTLVYDAEGRLLSGGGATYTYDGEGRRIKRVAAGSTYWYWYGADGGLIGEDTPEQIETGVQYLSTDALGSTRLVTKASQEVAARIDYWPFGEEIAASSSAGNRDLVSGYGGAVALKQRFTGKERDPEMGFDYFGARYLASGQGRFTSPDAPFADQKPDDPQSWNLYSYVRNNPLKFTDPTGRCLRPGGDCVEYGIGGVKAIANLPSDAATLLNRNVNALLGTNIPDAARFSASNANQQEGMNAATTVLAVSPVAEVVAQKAANAMTSLSTSEKVKSINGTLSEYAQTKRTTAVVETDKGSFAAGGTRNLDPAQRATARSVGATPVKGSGQHAEVAAINGAVKAGATPRAIEASRPFCTECRDFLRAAGATIESATRAVFK